MILFAVGGTNLKDYCTDNAVLSRTDLKRLRYGDVELCENLPTGQWRYSSSVETQYCKEIIKNWEREGSGWNL